MSRTSLSTIYKILNSYNEPLLEALSLFTLLLTWHGSQYFHSFLTGWTTVAEEKLLSGENSKFIEEGRVTSFMIPWEKAFLWIRDVINPNRSSTKSSKKYSRNWAVNEKDKDKSLTSRASHSIFKGVIYKSSNRWKTKYSAAVSRWYQLKSTHGIN